MHPGWPLSVGPIRVRAGVVRLRPVRLRDGSVWSRMRLTDRAHLEPWEPVGEVDWTARHAVSSWPALCSGLRAEARRGRMLPYVIELDGEFCGQLTIGNVTHGALRSAWIGYWVASDVTGGGVATGALALGLLLWREQWQRRQLALRQHAGEEEAVRMAVDVGATATDHAVVEERRRRALVDLVRERVKVVLKAGASGPAMKTDASLVGGIAARHPIRFGDAEAVEESLQLRCRTLADANDADVGRFQHRDRHRAIRPAFCHQARCHPAGGAAAENDDAQGFRR